MWERIDTPGKSYMLVLHVRSTRTFFWTDRNKHFVQYVFGGLPFLYASAFLFFRDDSPIENYCIVLNTGENGKSVFTWARYTEKSWRILLEKQRAVIIPVPMTVQKRRRRGYNQAEWFAAGIAAATGWEMDTAALKRVREKTSQTVYDREQRRENMKHAFTSARVYYKDILIVDDVITTGATMESCACAILENNQDVLVHFASLAYVE
jgi:predicted amidophosphoribosyltransferase